MRWSIGFCIFTLSLLSWPGYGTAQSSCSSTDRICSFSLGINAQDYVTAAFVVLYSTSQTTFETTNLSSGSDTYMLLIEASTGNVVCQNDDRAPGDYSSKIVVSQSTGDCNIPSYGIYRLVVRSYNGTSGGTCNLLQNGQAIYPSQISFGGHWWVTEYNASESFQAASHSLKGEGGADSLLILTKFGDFYSDLRFDDDGGLKYSAKVTTKTNSASNSTGAVVLGRLYGYPALENSNIIKVYRNDIEDSDYSYTAPVYCTHPKDHDCDGLGNQLEAALGTCACLTGIDVLCGFGGTGCSATYNARDTDGDGIPDAWEVFGRRWTDPQSGFTSSIEMSRFGADSKHKDVFVEIDEEYGFAPLTTNDLNTIFTAFSFGTGSDLNNPSGQAGLRVHIDIRGFSPALGKVNGMDDNRYSYGDWGGSEYYDPQASSATLADVRTGIFRNGTSVPSGSVNGAGVVFDNFSFRGWGNFLHELGHNLGLKHGGDPNISLSFNCKPNHLSIMNYATSGTHKDFSNGKFGSINPFSLNEAAGLSALGVIPSDYSFLSNIFAFDVDFSTGAVDWNRDGNKIGTNVKAFVFLPSSDCYGGGDPFLPETENYELVFQHKHITSKANVSCPSNYGSRDFCLPSTYKVKGGVAAAYFNSSLYVVSIVQDGSNNPQLLIKKYSGTTWSELAPISGAVPATNFSPTVGVANSKLYIAFVDQSTLALKILNLDTTDVASAVVNIGDITDQSPSFFAENASTLHLFFLQNNIVYRRTLQSGTTWSSKEVQKYQGSPNQDLKGSRAPALGVNNGIYLFIPRDSDERLEMYKRVGTDLWQKIGLVENTSRSKSIGRPAVVYDARTGYQHGFHLWYPTPDSGVYRFMTKAIPIVNDPLFWNRVSFTTSATDSPAIVITPPTFSSNTTFHSFLTLGETLYYLPHGDGIINELLPSVNDWKVMSKYLCAGIAIVKAQGGVSLGAGVSICEGKLSYH